MVGMALRSIAVVKMLVDQRLVGLQVEYPLMVTGAMQHLSPEETVVLVFS